MNHEQPRLDVSLPIEVRADGEDYISYCPALDLYSQGYTQEEALRNIVEAVQAFLESCYSRGYLDQVLRDCGFVLQGSGELQQLPTLVENQGTINVPLFLVADAKETEHRQNNAR